MRKIAVRHALRAMRRQGTQPGAVPLGLVCDVSDLPADEADRDLVIAARGALTQALTTLPPRQRVTPAPGPAIVGYSAAGKPVERLDVSRLQLRVAP